MFEAVPRVQSRRALTVDLRGARDLHATCISKVRPGSSTLRDCVSGSRAAFVRRLSVSNSARLEVGPHVSERLWRERRTPKRVFLATAARIFPDKACYDSGMFALAITLVILSEP